ncbi:MAG: EAL domain-containing protein [Phycisphaeraceae bacterium]|nr:EAL domain-containing protein [Phycisphaeraceae bacterium]
MSDDNNSNSNSNRILVIDDSPAIHEDFQKILGSGAANTDELDAMEAMMLGGEEEAEAAEMSFELTHAHQGEEGYNCYRQAKEAGDPFFMVFVDMRMPPGWDGLQTIKAIRQIDDEAAIVVCTAYSDHSWEEIAEQCNNFDKLLILKKPFDPIEVTSLAKSLHERWELQMQARLRTDELERLVRLRTSELEIELAKDKDRMDQLEQAVAERTAELRKLAFTDKLTGLPNRVQFHDVLIDAVAANQRDPGHAYAVMFIDFDGFKTVNDSLGHDSGDLLIQQIGGRLKGAMEGKDFIARDISPLALAARLGGDEFCVLIDGYQDESEVMASAHALLEAFKQPYDIGGTVINSSASIGVTLSRFNYDSAEDVLRDADTAMYAAKAGGRGMAMLFEESMHESAKLQMALKNDMHLAMDEDQLAVWYQPIVSLESQHAIGAEALLRWMHPEYGMVSPMDFIPIAEESGLICEMGAWVLEQVCLQLARFPKLKYMSFNVSRYQFADPTFIDRFDQVIARTGVDPGRLVAEVTESSMNQDAAVAAQCIKQMRNSGMRVYLDDFGTGLSSLGALRNLTVDGIKLDRSFLDDTVFSRRAAAIIDSAVTLANDLDMQLIVEGVESVEQVAMLQSLRCPAAQGYLFSRPVPEADLSQLLAKPSALSVKIAA